MLDLAFWAILILNSFDPSSAEKQNDLTKELVFRTRFRAFSNSFDQIICVRTKIDLKSKIFFFVSAKNPKKLEWPFKRLLFKKSSFKPRKAEREYKTLADAIDIIASLDELILDLVNTNYEYEFINFK